MYGHIAKIDISGKVKGHTSMVLRFDRLVMPDGRRGSIHAENIESYHAPSGEKVDVEGAIESGGRGRKSIEHTAIGAGLAPCWAEFSAEVREPESDPSSAASVVWGLPHFMDVRRSRSAADKKS